MPCPSFPFSCFPVALQLGMATDSFKGMPDIGLLGKFFFLDKIKEFDEGEDFYPLLLCLEQWCEDVTFATVTCLSCDQTWRPRRVRRGKIEAPSLMAQSL